MRHGNGIIGSTGFVGLTLHKQMAFSGAFNSSNAGQIGNSEFDTFVIAAAPAKKWIANGDPKADLSNIESMIKSIEQVQANRVVLFSTVDVFQDSRGKTESATSGFETIAAYGSNRRYLEKRTHEIWPDALVIRLPGLVGPGLQKNALFDLKSLNQVEKLNPSDVFQFYPMVNLAHDMNLALNGNLKVAHLVAEPIELGRIALDVFGINLPAISTRPPMHYDLQTTHSEIFGGSGRYTYSARESLTAIRAFAQAT